MQLSAENLKLPANAAALMPYGLKVSSGGSGGPNPGALVAGGASHSALVAAAAAHYHPSVAQTMTQVHFNFILLSKILKHLVAKKIFLYNC